MSTEAVAEVEERILSKVSALKTSICAEDKESAMKICRELEMLWTERNRKLAASK